MKERLRYFIKGLALVIVLGGLLSLFNWVLTPKYLYNQDWPTTSTYLGFYGMERDTVDVLFLGSSHAMSAFSPQEIYDAYGLRTYNLGSEQQSGFISYYWLKEALRYQSPKAVVLDTCFFFKRNTEPLNSGEAFVRKALDFMKWSPVKLEAVQAIRNLDTKQSRMSYFFPNIRYHSRWTDLQEEDMPFSQMASHTELKGFTIRNGRSGEKGYEPFEKDSDHDSAIALDWLMEEYLRKIAELCKARGISLILVKTPTHSMRIGHYNTICSFAQENGIDYYDFNEKTLYEEANLDFQNDMDDFTHLNYLGARKISRWIGKILTEKYRIDSVYDEQWERTKAFCEASLSNAGLQYITDAAEYLNTLNTERNTVFIATKDFTTEHLNNEMLDAMHRLGLDEMLENQSQNCHYAVLSQTHAEEGSDEQFIEAQGLVREEKTMYRMSCAGFDYGNACSIQIDGIECAQNRRGINIVVYDNALNSVVDSVCIDIHVPQLTVMR